jgi:nucleotide sugar dehydrogenase
MEKRIVTETSQIAVIGCGAVGLPLAVAFASRDAEVLGVDRDMQLIAKLASGKPELLDDGLEDSLRQGLAAGNIRFAQSLGKHPGRRVFVLAVPTPVDDQGRWNREAIEDAFAQTLAAAHDDDLVVIKSTVPVGTTRSLAMTAGRVGRTLHVAACPDRSISGMSLREQFAIPHIVGGVTDAAAQIAAKEFARLGKVRLVKNAETAELLKLVTNVQRDVSFALANQFSILCEDLGIAFDELADAAQDEYPRLNLANPGWVGGPCLSKDAYLLATAVPERQDLVSLALCARKINSAVLIHCTQAIANCAQRVATPVIAILGLAFKGQPRTRDQRGSLGTHLVATLREHVPQAVIRAWDPEATDRGKTPVELAERADIVVVANNHPDVLALAPARLAAVMRPGGTIFDLAGIPREMPADLPNGVALRRLGNSNLVRVD